MVYYFIMDCSTLLLGQRRDCFSIISDHMILQSGAEISIWGTADKGEQVVVREIEK